MNPAEHDRLIALGLKLVGTAWTSRSVGLLGRRRLRRALGCFESAIAMEPDRWPTLWFLGKTRQVLGDDADALKHFAAAFRLNPEHPDVAREACITAMMVGDAVRAVEYGRAAVRANAHDAGLHANLACAYVLAADIVSAKSEMAVAKKQAPDDPRIVALKRLIDTGRVGTAPVVRTLADLDRAVFGFSDRSE